MAINPDTNEIERLKAASAAASGALDKLTQLVRPDGSPVPQHWTVLKEGELVEMKGYTWRVAYFNEKTVVLEPVRPEDALK